MAWVDPKTNWSSADGVRDTDMNRIEGNILQLYRDSSQRESRSVYVAPTGNDSTGNGTSAAPYATITKALSTVSKNLNGASVTIHITTGTYNEAVSIKGFDSPIILSGGYNATASITSLRVDGCIVFLDGVHIITSGAQGVVVTNGGKLVGNGRITANGATSGVMATYGGLVSMTAITCNNSSNYGLNVDTGGRINTTNLDGNNNTTGMIAQGGGIITYNIDNMTATGTKKLTYGGGRIYTGSM